MLVLTLHQPTLSADPALSGSCLHRSAEDHRSDVPYTSALLSTREELDTESFADSQADGMLGHRLVIL